MTTAEDFESQNEERKRRLRLLAESMKNQETRYIAERVKHLGLLDPEIFEMGDEFYPAHLSVALIDAVFTPRNHYKNHVLPAIQRYCKHFEIEQTRLGECRDLLPPEHKQETLRDIVTHYKTYGADHMRKKMFRACYKSPGTEIFKSDNVYNAAEKLLEIGISNLQDASSENANVIKKALCSIKGIGEATAHMFLMYSGEENYVKGDVHICNFVARTLGIESINPRKAEQLVRDTAKELGVTPRSLDYAIWKYGSDFS